MLLFFKRSVAVVALVAVSFSASAQNKKLTPEELIANHIKAIGSREAIAASQTRAITGPVKLVRLIGTAAQLDGKGVMISAGPKYIFIMRFPTTEYPVEQMVFDGERSATGVLPQGQRSNLSQFLDQQNLPLREGLIGGTLSTAWALLRLEEKHPKLEYAGLKKIDGRLLHELRYRQRKGSSDLKVTLYFDETFHHVRTSYKFEIGARIGFGPNDSTTIQESYYTLSEDFDEFREVDGLLLPHYYRQRLSVQTSTGSTMIDWTLKVSEISHREKVDDQTFKLIGNR
ncbi:MAG: hypothetical protein AB1631_16050 [Acidobacteriota bacterium]